VGCGGGLGSRLRLLTARARRPGLADGTGFRRTIGLGAVTVISGKAVAAPLAGACASCAEAAPNAHNNSDAEPEARSLRFNDNDIVLILPKPNPLTSPTNQDCDFPVDVRRTDFD
jgi:hypothetical protein